MTRLWLDPIPENLREKALGYLRDGHADWFLGMAQNTESLDLVYYNRTELLRLGCFEQALLRAIIGTRTNNSRWPITDLRYLFSLADKGRLRALGDPLPGAGPFTIFRGVAGWGRRRMVRGISWTGSLDVACWFANRPHFTDPAVYTVTVAAPAVAAYLDESGRNEEEFLLCAPPKPVLVSLSDTEIEEHAKQYESVKTARRMLIGA
jgi:hypothetical protein